jgi:hypothetical protein
MSINIDRLRELCAKGLSRDQIAQRLGVTHNAVHQACKRHGISVAAAAGYESRVGSSVKTACAVIESSGSGE